MMCGTNSGQHINSATPVLMAPNYGGIAGELEFRLAPFPFTVKYMYILTDNVIPLGSSLQCWITVNPYTGTFGVSDSWSGKANTALTATISNGTAANSANLSANVLERDAFGITWVITGAVPANTHAWVGYEIIPASGFENRYPMMGEIFPGSGNVNAYSMLVGPTNTTESRRHVPIGLVRLEKMYGMFCNNGVTFYSPLSATGLDGINPQSATLTARINDADAMTVTSQSGLVLARSTNSFDVNSSSTFDVHITSNNLQANTELHPMFQCVMPQGASSLYYKLLGISG